MSCKLNDVDNWNRFH